MRSPKNIVIAFLAMTTLAGAALAWKQYGELTELRAAALNPAERADWQKRLWTSEKSRAELESQVAAHAPAVESPTAPELPDQPVVPGPRRGRDTRDLFAAMMDKPEVQRLLALQHKGALDARYAPLFKSLGLSPEQLDRFKNLLVEKSTAMMDVAAAARAQGINPRTNRDAFGKLLSDAQADIDASIRSALGEPGFAQYQDYEHTLPQRAVVNQLEQRLSYTSTPLTPQQTAQMVQVLAATTPATTGAPTRPGLFGAGRGQVTVTEATVNQALGVLAAPQLDALRQIQQEQQAQADLASAFRSQGRANRLAPTAGTPATAVPPTATGPGG